MLTPISIGEMETNGREAKILVVDEDDLARKVFRLVVNETRLCLELWEVSNSKNVFLCPRKC